MTKSSIIRITLVIILCISGVIVSWNKAYEIGYGEAYSIGITAGENYGKNIGYSIGYEEGYLSGNTSGVQSGYNEGYEAGKNLGYSNGYDEGYDVGEEEGFFEANQTVFISSFQTGVNVIENRAYNVSRVTFSEVKAYLRRDKTDQELYIKEGFVCHDFAQTVKTNGFKQGIHCYYVTLDFPMPPGHALVAFNTTDRGLVYFEPQSDEQMSVDIGVRYWRDNGDYHIKYDDTITRIELVW